MSDTRREPHTESNRRVRKCISSGCHLERLPAPKNDEASGLHQKKKKKKKINSRYVRSTPRFWRTPDRAFLHYYISPSPHSARCAGTDLYSVVNWDGMGRGKGGKVEDDFEGHRLGVGFQPVSESQLQWSLVLCLGSVKVEEYEVWEVGSNGPWNQ